MKHLLAADPTKNNDDTVTNGKAFESLKRNGKQKLEPEHILKYFFLVFHRTSVSCLEMQEKLLTGNE